MKEKIIFAEDFMDAFYVAAAGQDEDFIKCVEMVMADMDDIREFGYSVEHKEENLKNMI